MKGSQLNLFGKEEKSMKININHLRNWKSLIFGFLLGIFAMTILSKNNSPPIRYVKITQDYFIENVGVIRKGTILKVDKGFSEGFTRYVLFLNISSSEKFDLHNSDFHDEIVPYWLKPKRSE